ncbi:MAG: D-2-hydroxyacid dehydrogenase [Clostridia bacterium]|nr:D-2-hydroxyacid dehydrogenase [Clostridia bacterium]
MSAKKIVVVLPQLEDQYRSRIRAAAEAHGLEVSFFGTAAESLPALADAEIILGQSPELAQNAPALRWICTPSAGVNQFLGEGVFASPRAVLSNSSGAYGVTIAEHTLMMILALFRQRPAYDGIVARREWKRDLPVRSILGGRFLLAGTGDIGQEIAVRLKALGAASVLGVNRSGRNPKNLFDRVVPISEWESLLPEPDALILSLPGTPETNHLLGARQLSLLRDGAAVINVGRGTVIDQAALEAELRAGRLCAALDVFEQEPLPADHSLWSCPHLLITPHIAGNMTLPWTVKRIVELFLEDLENYCAGRPLARRVDLKKGY